MKIFWSWQSDTPGSVGRHFVRDVLRETVVELKESADISDALRDEIHLDHDREGLTGSPDLARKILEKIAASAIFIADVTIVGEAALANGSNKKIINSNVAIELGFAFGTIGDDKVLMLQNTHFGERDHLPFDLRGKGGPLQFNISPDADEATKLAVARQLRGQFKQALRPFVETSQPHSEPPRQMTRHQWDSSPLHFRGIDSVGVLNRGTDKQQTVRFDHPCGVYLRFIPSLQRREELTSARVLEIAREQHLALLEPQMAPALADRNPEGAAYFRLPPDGSKRATAVSQLFLSGEMWAVSAAFTQGRTPSFDLGSIREPLLRTLRSFHKVYTEDLAGDAQATVEIGAVGLRGLHCFLGLDRRAGPYYDDWISIEGTLGLFEDELEREALVEKFITRAIEEAGERVKSR